MAKIENREVLKRIEKECFISPAAEATPKELSNTVVPVIVANPDRISSLVLNSTVTNGTSATLYTVPTGYTLYITASHLHVIKDATSTSTFSAIRIPSDPYLGTNKDIISLASITLTAQSDGLSISYPIPVRVSSGEAVNLINSAATANIKTAGGICGYLIKDN